MQGLTHWQETLTNVLDQIIERLTLFFPNVIGALVLLLLGWIVAYCLRLLTLRFIQVAEKALLRLTNKRIATANQLSATSTKIIGSIIFWVVILFFLTAATQVLGLQTFTIWLSKVVDYLPTVFVGLLIILAGFLVSKIVREIVVATAVNASDKQRAIIGRVVQGAILVTAILVGAEQIGIKVTFLVILAAVASASIVVAVALSISIGAKDYVANLIGAHYLRHRYSIGQRVRLADFEGRILELTETSVTLETTEGRVSIPAKIFNEQPIVLLVSPQHDG
ncbi:MAG: mechanosensitive ion channel family protein [Methylophilaceae bacterium]